jgi:hypothetical protein
VGAGSRAGDSRDETGRKLLPGGSISSMTWQPCVGLWSLRDASPGGRGGSHHQEVELVDIGASHLEGPAEFPFCLFLAKCDLVARWVPHTTLSIAAPACLGAGNW